MLRKIEYVGAVILAVACIGLAATWQDETAEQPDVIKLESGTTLREMALEDSSWLLIDHESGAEYVLRETAIIGFASRQPGTSGRNTIMLSGGASIYTEVTADEFAEVLRRYVID